eukprot:jgi/Tetstr1/439370/TSEL_027805.t1
MSTGKRIKLGRLHSGREKAAQASKRVAEGDADYDRKGKRPAQPAAVEAPSRTIHAPEDGWLDKDGKVHRRHTADARILQRDLDDVFQIYDLLAPAEEPLRDLVEDGTDLPASSPASSAELFKTITAALALCTTVALRINKRGNKLHVEHEYGAEVAKEFDAVDPLGGKGSADYKELKKAIEKVKAKKPSSSSSREKPSSSSREPESFHRGSDDRREGGRREEKSPSASKRVAEGDADYDRKGKRPAQPAAVEAPSRTIHAPEDGWLDKDGKVHRRHTADARILQRDLDDVFQIYDLLAPAEEPLRDLVEDGTDLPASSPASSAELFKTITAALALCTTVALRINKRGNKLHVEHEYGAEVAKEFDAVDPLGGKGSADYKELKKAIEKVKAKKPSSSSSREKPSSSSREPESFHRGSDDRREGGRREEKSPSASKRVAEGDADYDRKGKRPAQPAAVEAPSRTIHAPEDGWLDKDGKVHRRHTADARILQRDLDDVFQIYDLLAPAEEPLRDLVEDGTDLPASSPASSAELFKTITAALALCTTVALRINKRGNKLHVEHEYGAEVAKEFDAVDPLGGKGSADYKELKKAIEKVKAKKPSSSSSREKPSSSSREPESFHRGSDDRREGGRREEKSPSASKRVAEGDADYDRKGKRPAQPAAVEAPSRTIHAPEDGWLDKDGKVHRRHTADARILQRDLDDVFQIYDLLAPAEEPLRDLVEDGTDLPASSPASSAELFKTITAALALCTTVALRINKRGNKLHVEHEYGAEVAKEFDAVDPLGGKGSADYKELKKAIEKVKAKKPSSSSSREKPSSSSREPESFHRGSDDRREGGRREEKSPSVVSATSHQLAGDAFV